MKNVRVKVRESCNGYWYDIAICVGKAVLLCSPTRCWKTIPGATRNAKAMAKRIGIKFDPEIVKQQHGC